MTLIDKAEALAILAPAPNAKDGLWAKRKKALYDRVDALPARGVGVKPLVWRDGVTTDRLLAATVILDAPEDQAAYERNRAARIMDALELTPAPTDAAQAREAAMQELIDAYEDIIDYGPLVLAKKDQWERVRVAKEKLK